MSTTLTIILMAVLVIADVLAFTKYRDYFTYEVEETLLVDDNGKVIKILDSKVLERKEGE